MELKMTQKQFRRLLDLVYIGNWVLNSTRGDDRFQDYDDLESKIFALSLPNCMERHAIRIRIDFCLNSIKTVSKSRFYGITHLTVRE